MNKISEFIRRKYSLICLWLLVPILLIWGLRDQVWQKPENIIAWDVKSYYSYLPATFIHQDLSLEFIRNDTMLSRSWIWPIETPTKNLAIVTSMGLSFLYTPFFLIGHTVALLSPSYEADGYTDPYSYALYFSALFYVMLALFILRRFLRRYYSEPITLITLLLIVFSTNLLFFLGPMAAMPHSYNFFLFALFLLLNRHWYEKQSVKNTIFLGLVSGLITLVRPTNIIILLILFFWNVYTWKGIQHRVVFFLRQYRMVLLMILSFVLIWIPQFIYWKYISGKFFYFTYGDVGGKFFWDNPQIWNVLFSFRKGWFIYTPIAMLAVIGIPFLSNSQKKFLLPISLFVLINVYIQSSWWCWWFGGSFGARAFVDSYALLTIPLAALLSYFSRFKWTSYTGAVILIALIWFNTYQIKKYNHQTIHYWWMSRDAYLETLFKTKATVRYWKLIPVPDYEKARKGIYVSSNLISRYEGEMNISPEMIIEEIKKDLSPEDIKRGLKKRGEENNLSIDSLLTIEAWNIYETKRNLSGYIETLENSLRNSTENQSDSLSLGL